MDSLAVAFLGVIAFSSLVQAAFLVALTVHGRRVERRLGEVSERLEREIQPAIAHLTRVSRNAAEVSDLAVVEARRLDLALATLTERVDDALRIAQRLVIRPLRPLSDLAALVRGVRRGIDVYHRLRGPATNRRPTRRPEGDDEHMFI